MLLATRCPFCETVFRLQPEQLTLRRGLVRCGHCHEVFDASSHLFDVTNGTSVNKAKRVSLDDVTAYTLGKLADGAQAPVPEGTVPVVESGASAETHRVVPPAEDAGMHAVESASPHVAEATIEPVAAHPAEAVDEAARSEEPSTGHVPTQAPPDEAPVEAPVEAKDSTPSTPPDFRAEAWNPWAPAPDASIDGSIRHNAAAIPLEPVTIPSSAQPPLTLELTDPNRPKPEKSTARKSAGSHVEPQAGQKAAPTVEAQAEPKIEPSVAKQAEPKAQPSVAAQPQPNTVQPAEASAAPTTEPPPETTPERVLEQETAEPPPHTWRAAEPARESAQAGNTGTSGESKAEADARLHEPLHEPRNETSHEGLYEPLRDKRPKPFFDDDASTPPDPHRGREPYFGSSADEHDYEPRFGGDSRRPFASTPDDDDDAFAVRREPLAQGPRRVMWQALGGVAIGVLGVLLLGQLAWWQRESVMVAWPDSQSLYMKACANLGCKVGPPRDIDGLLVEPSDLRQIDGPHKLELKMPLRNRFDIALAYPAVELTLLDENNNVAVRRVLWPQDYVKPGTPIAAGLPARTTQTMIVRLDTGGTVASNFRVQIFYP